MATYAETRSIAWYYIKLSALSFYWRHFLFRYADFHRVVIKFLNFHPIKRSRIFLVRFSPTFHAPRLLKSSLQFNYCKWLIDGVVCHKQASAHSRTYLQIWMSACAMWCPSYSKVWFRVTRSGRIIQTSFLSLHFIYLEARCKCVTSSRILYHKHR